MNRIQRSIKEIEYLWYESSKIISGKWWRWIGLPFSQSFIALATYRIDRGLYLLLGNSWIFIRFLMAPIAFLLGPWTGRERCSIHYQAEIGKGLRILHPELGLIVTKFTVAGQNLILTGGNLVGSRRKLKKGDIQIGNNVLLGGYAIILGPNL